MSFSAPSCGSRVYTDLTRQKPSTVFPVTEAVAEEFQKVAPEVRVTVGISGTGGGFQKFCRTETDISDASRPISSGEIEACHKNGVGFIELPIAYDGIAVVVSRKATWIDHITVDELKTLWAPEAQGKVTRWRHVRAGWPDREIHLFGAGVDSGTYDYFTEAIVGTVKASRGDFTSSEDDNVVVQGIANDELALGFLPFAYVGDNAERLKIVAVDDGDSENGAGPILPDFESIRTGTYQPLARPIFIYVSDKAVARPAVQRFVDFYLTEGGELAEEVGYVQLGAEGYRLVAEHYRARTMGTVFGEGVPKVGVTIEQLLSRERLQ
ncbi:MAG: PstS family phosphate ABC transporter substrate-binding protein [Acidobacteria bacterium]|nr:PstS family phosphate ABC transporter substrate-binding protein [Acidobacteriota bacterium]